MTMRLVLGSGSATRRAMLEQAGLVFEIDPPRVDEDAVKAGWTGDAASLAAALARAKALEVSARQPGALVIGADQVLELDGEIFSKPGNRDGAAAHLRRLAGRTHVLRTAMVLARDGAVVFETRSAPALTMRALPETVIESYLEAAPESVWATVGGYQVEGPGIRLFECIDGGWHDILGLPLLVLLGWLRENADE
ncbi:Maf family protein [Minwuia thermotolerans]|nr:Maf family protein [Minwuia thermotolerans]